MNFLASRINVSKTGPKMVGGDFEMLIRPDKLIAKAVIKMSKCRKP